MSKSLDIDILNERVYYAISLHNILRLNATNRIVSVRRQRPSVVKSSIDFNGIFTLIDYVVWPKWSL
jgi:hypothetical protein